MNKDSDGERYSLRAHGLRTTPQRALILRVLQQADEHLDAQGIWQRARLQDESINLATVYRSLNALLGVSLIKQSFLDEGQKRAYFEAVDKPEHFHFACIRCGKVIELNSERVLLGHLEIEQGCGCRVLNIYLKLEGYCPDCLSSQVPIGPVLEKTSGGTT
jgi:Fe2+ or Zn2+ uptake regulation protein